MTQHEAQEQLDEAFWDERYRSQSSLWSGTPTATHHHNPAAHAPRFHLRLAPVGAPICGLEPHNRSTNRS